MALSYLASHAKIIGELPGFGGHGLQGLSMAPSVRSGNPTRATQKQNLALRTTKPHEVEEIQSGPLRQGTLQMPNFTNKSHVGCVALGLEVLAALILGVVVLPTTSLSEENQAAQTAPSCHVKTAALVVQLIDEQAGCCQVPELFQSFVRDSVRLWLISSIKGGYPQEILWDLLLEDPGSAGTDSRFSPQTPIDREESSSLPTQEAGGSTVSRRLLFKDADLCRERANFVERIRILRMTHGPKPIWLRILIPSPGKLEESIWAASLACLDGALTELQCLIPELPLILCYQKDVLSRFGLTLVKIFPRTQATSLLWIECPPEDQSLGAVIEPLGNTTLVVASPQEISFRETKDLDEVCQQVLVRWLPLLRRLRSLKTSLRMEFIQPITLTPDSSSHLHPTTAVENRAFLIGGLSGDQPMTALVPSVYRTNLGTAILRSRTLGDLARALAPQGTLTAACFRGFPTLGDSLARWAKEQRLVATWDPWGTRMRLSDVRMMDVIINDHSEPNRPRESPGISFPSDLWRVESSSGPLSTDLSGTVRAPAADVLPEFVKVFTPSLAFEVSIRPENWHIQVARRLTDSLGSPQVRASSGPLSGPSLLSAEFSLSDASRVRWGDIHDALATKSMVSPREFAETLRKAFGEGTIAPVVVAGNPRIANQLAEALRSQGIPTLCSREPLKSQQIAELLRAIENFLYISPINKRGSTDNLSVYLGVRGATRTWNEQRPEASPKGDRLGSSAQILRRQHPWYLVGDETGRELSWVLDAEHLNEEQILTQIRTLKDQLNLPSAEQDSILVAGVPEDRKFQRTVDTLKKRGYQVKTLRLTDQELQLPREELIKRVAAMADNLQTKFVVLVLPEESTSQDSETEEPPQCFRVMWKWHTDRSHKPIHFPPDFPFRDRARFPSPPVAPLGGVLVDPVPVEDPRPLPRGIAEEIKRKLREGQGPLRPLEGIFSPENKEPAMHKVQPEGLSDE